MTYPATIQRAGLTYDKTGKEGTRLSDGKPSAEYEHLETAHRVWMTFDGFVTDE